MGQHTYPLEDLGVKIYTLWEVLGAFSAKIHTQSETGRSKNIPLRAAYPCHSINGEECPRSPGPKGGGFWLTFLEKHACMLIAIIVWSFHAKDAYNRFWENWLPTNNFLTTNGSDSTRPASMKSQVKMDGAGGDRAKILLKIWLLRQGRGSRV